MRRSAVAAIALIACPICASGAAAQVLRVGTYKGAPGQYATIQAAVDAASPYDWILVAPGDYKTTSIQTVSGSGESYPAAVLITTPDLTLRGMNRSTVVVDGTKPGSPQCSNAPADQNYGPATPGGAGGLNGVMVWKADDVSVENMTACNFLAGPGGNSGNEGGTGSVDIGGNEFWWNGGYDSAAVGGWGFYGSYLTATSTFYNSALPPLQAEATAAQYGIFSSDWSGGTWDQTYASNFNDSGYYIGACQQICDQTVNHAWAEDNALGYSGSNSGGSLVVENSQFDNNEDGFDTNSQNGDNPPPQNGACPSDGISPITHTHSCWVFMGNDVHDNNNPNVPTAGEAAAGPVGTGMSISGGRNDTVMDNTFANNGAWGDILVPYPDSGGPCTGGQPNNLILGPGSCLYDESGDAIIDNTYSNDGFFGNATNGDFDQFNLNGGEPTNCYSGNTVAGGGSLSPDAAVLEADYPTCDGAIVLPNLNALFLAESACDSEIALIAGAPVPCLPTDSYPRASAVVMHPLPANLPPMPGVCAGVPANPWCSGQVTRVKGCVASARTHAALELALRESFVSVSVKVGHAKAVTHRARGRRTRVSIDLGRRRGRRLRVGFLERIKVGGHREKISFTRIYSRCA
ncbi:MAG TPA: hypothetical protein VIJ20_05135 [Solirubrobacteraceae bacterium]